MKNLFYKNINKKLQDDFIKNKPYAHYGKNIIGLIHNFKNKISIFYSFLTLVEADKNIEKDLRDIARFQIGSMRDLIVYLDNILLSIKNNNFNYLRNINVNDLIESLIELFNSDLEFKKSIRIEFRALGKDLILNTNPMYFNNSVENLVKNSYEFLKETEKNPKKICIMVKNIKNERSLSISDNGVGIEFCNKCNLDSCLSNKCSLKVGYTTKNNEFGMGLYFLRELIRIFNIKVKITSQINKGTKIKLYFL